MVTETGAEGSFSHSENRPGIVHSQETFRTQSTQGGLKKPKREGEGEKETFVDSFVNASWASEWLM